MIGWNNDPLNQDLVTLTPLKKKLYYCFHFSYYIVLAVLTSINSKQRMTPLISILTTLIISIITGIILEGYFRRQQQKYEKSLTIMEIPYMMSKTVNCLGLTFSSFSIYFSLLVPIMIFWLAWTNPDSLANTKASLQL